MIEPINEAGALLIWQRELRQNERKATTPDNLWYAACLEARAREEVAEGLIAAANDDRVEAAERLLLYFAEAQAA